MRFINYNKLDRPEILSDIKFDIKPFYNDYYYYIIIKNNEILYITDEILIDDCNGNNIKAFSGEIIESKYIKINSNHCLEYIIRKLPNNWINIYLYQIHQWDDFESIGIINILSDDNDYALEFFNKNIKNKIKFPEKKVPKHNINIKYPEKKVPKDNINIKYPEKKVPKDNINIKLKPESKNYTILF